MPPSHPTDEDRPLAPETRLLHAGYDPGAFHGFVNPPVVHASTVLFHDAASHVANAQKYTYGRTGTPTIDALELALAEPRGPRRCGSRPRASRRCRWP